MVTELILLMLVVIATMFLCFITYEGNYWAKASKKLLGCDDYTASLRRMCKYNVKTCQIVFPILLFPGTLGFVVFGINVLYGTGNNVLAVISAVVLGIAVLVSWKVVIIRNSIIRRQRPLLVVWDEQKERIMSWEVGTGICLMFLFIACVTRPINNLHVGLGLTAVLFAGFVISLLSARWFVLSQQADSGTAQKESFDRRLFRSFLNTVILGQLSIYMVFFVIEAYRHGVSGT